MLKPPRGLQLNRAHPLSRGLVGCWLFNERTGLKAVDISGHQNHGELKHGVAWAPSKHGGGLKFDGVDDYVEVTDDESTDITSGTVSVWVKFLANEGWNDKLFAKSRTNTGTRIFYGIVEQGTWKAIIASGIANKVVDFGSHNLNQWYHLSFTFENLGATTEIKTYMDGAFKNSDTADFIIGSDATWGYALSDDYIGIGAHGAGTVPVNCSIDSVRIYNRALSAEEVKTLYLDPFCNMMKRPISRLYVAVSGAVEVNLLDAKLRIKDTSTDNLDGKLIIGDKEINLLDSKVQIKDIETKFLDGKLIVKDAVANLLDGKVQVKDDGINLVDGKLIVQSGGTETNLLDSKLKVKDSETNFLDGKLIVKDVITNLLDGKIIINNETTNLLDGKMTIKDFGAVNLDGKLIVKDTTIEFLDGKLKITEEVTDNLDGKIIIKDVETALIDGKLIIKDIETALLDGKLIIQEGVSELDKNNQLILDSKTEMCIQLGNSKINTWNTLGRPTGKKGIIGFNTTTNKIEVYDGSAWKSVSLT